MLIIFGIIYFIIVWTYFSFNWRSWRRCLDLWQLNKEKVKITKSRAYKSVDELIDHLKEKDVWYKELYLIIRVRAAQFLDIPRDVYRFFVRGIQRWVRGWCDEDVWGVDYYLMEIIPPMLRQLKETKQGIPVIVGKMETDEEMAEAEKLWNAVLDSIIWTFETGKKIAENDLAYFEDWSQEKCDEYNKIWTDWKYESKPRAMTLEECKKYEAGWANFKKYFYNLWD
jgi:hypothetical protein